MGMVVTITRNYAMKEHLGVGGDQPSKVNGTWLWRACGARGHGVNGVAYGCTAGAALQRVVVEQYGLVNRKVHRRW